MSSHATSGPETTGRGWRFKCGVALFCLMIVLVLLIPISAASGMAPSKVATITGAIFVGNKVILLLTIAVMGKAGFQELKGIIGGYVPRLKSDGIVSPARHVIGLIMFCLPIITAWLEPYIDAIAPGLRPNLWQLQLLGDVMLVASIFVLGGNFWEKVRALFVRTARVADPSVNVGG